jgi:hypothetical protein
MARLRSVQAAIGLVMSSTAALGAAAEPVKTELELDRTAEAGACIDAPRLMRNVERRLRRKVFVSDSEAELKIKVGFERAGNQWTARVQVSDALGALGRRDITTEARHCSAIDDSLALVVALLVDTPPVRPEPVAVIAAREVPPQASKPAPRDEAPPIFTAIELPKETLAPREPFQFDVRGCGTLGLGLLSGLAPGIELGVGVKPPTGPWIRLFGELFFAREHGVSNQGAGARLSTSRIGLEICGLSTRIGAFGAEVCVAQKLGRIHALGFGFDQNLDSARLYYALALGGNAVASLTRSLGVFVGLHGEIPFTRDRFIARLEELGEVSVFRASPVAAVARLGLRAEL